jgi:hypothetical protein
LRAVGDQSALIPEEANEQAWRDHWNNKCGPRAFAQVAGRTPVFVIADAGLLAA